MAALLAPPPASAQTRTLRVVTYNIEADVNVWPGPLPGLIAPPSNTNDVQAGGVLEGIGEEIAGNDAPQPVDIFALEETTSNSLTVAPIVAGLNAFYGLAGLYSNSSYQATQFGGKTNNGFGNGPNAMVFNTHTLQLLASVPVDPAGGTNNLGSTSGEYREVMRYKFAPAGVAANASNVFYVYVSHYKSGTGTAIEKDRLGEAQIIRTNEAIDLPATARVLYVGDYNVTSNGEASYQTILSNAAPNGVQQGGAIDPMNPSNTPNIDWGMSTTDTNILAQESESDTDLRYRDDFQLMTTNVYYGAPGGLNFVPGTYHVFANNGSVAYNGSVNSGADTALNNTIPAGSPISAAQLYLDLVNASDHLPVVADYTIPVPAPLISGVTLAGSNLVVSAANCATGGYYVVRTSLNLSVPLTNWTALATNVAGGGNFTLTATNAVNQTGAGQFYILQEQ